MTIRPPKADFYHVGLHKLGSTYLRARVYPLFEDPESLRDDELHSSNCYGWKSSKGGADQTVILHSYNTISGYPDRPNAQGPALVHDVNPDAKIVISIRSQATMLRSIYWLCVKTGDDRSFDRFAGDVIANGKLDYDALVGSYRKTFGEENVLVLIFEELASDPQMTVERLAHFFGVPVPELLDDKATPIKIGLGDLEVDIRRRLNAHAARRGHKNTHRTYGAMGRLLIAAAHRGDLAFRRLFGRSPTLIRLRDQERLLREAYGESNRRLFASLYDCPFASRYPGLERDAEEADAKAVAAVQDLVS